MTAANAPAIMAGVQILGSAMLGAGSGLMIAYLLRWFE